MDSITYIRDKSPESGWHVVGWSLSGNASGNAWRLPQNKEGQKK